MSTTAPTSIIGNELSVRFLLLDDVKGLYNTRRYKNFCVRPGERKITENIVRDMKQYFIIKRPKWKENILEKTEVEQLEREYHAIKAIGEHINLIRIEEYHNEDNIVYLAFEFAIATSLYHYLAIMGAREPIP